ncbi:MAG: FKBP-type peptidyl-prolyl cis-trans isomerase [Blastochloris sp.]|nr:FKBP-type peptidyl-prolyl cis-trans isomerase [Blastochloris sp.]
MPTTLDKLQLDSTLKLVFSWKNLTTLQTYLTMKKAFLLITLLFTTLGLTSGVHAQDALKNITEEFNFLRENAEREGIKTTQSGLQYEVLKSGSGKTPTASSTVVTHYKGTTLSGKTFDSSLDRGKPATFRVDKVVAGWTEALQLMKEGDRWKLFIPSKLAYGSAGSPPVIEPNQMLIFEIELINVN